MRSFVSTILTNGQKVVGTPVPELLGLNPGPLGFAKFHVSWSSKVTQAVLDAWSILQESM